MLGIDELMMTIDNQAATDFVRRNIGKEVDGDLLATIDTLFECWFNINLASKKLGIHRHTLRNKLEKFVELTKCDIRDPVRRQDAWIAIKLCRSLNIKDAGASDRKKGNKRKSSHPLP
jgi:DNA-binding PucR family transcriptional regulator